jgi:hypothetical protein
VENTKQPCLVIECKRVPRSFGRTFTRSVSCHQCCVCTAAKDVTTVTVSVFSGSVTYINSSVPAEINLPRGLALGVVDHHFHGRLRNGRPSGLSATTVHPCLTWTRLRHEVVGGTTHYVALFCSSTRFSPAVTNLRRTLGHIVDYGIRPQCSDITNDRHAKALTLTDRLYLEQLSQMIVYPTHFCCKGFGYQSLTSIELAHAYGLPVLSRVGGITISAFEHLMPSHFFHVILNSVNTVSSIHSPPSSNVPSQSRLPLFKFPCASRSWIVPVGRWLSHSWIDQLTIRESPAKQQKEMMLRFMSVCGTHEAYFFIPFVE